MAVDMMKRLCRKLCKAYERMDLRRLSEVQGRRLTSFYIYSESAHYFVNREILKNTYYTDVKDAYKQDDCHCEYKSGEAPRGRG